ncbi:MAG: hypothetical protein EON90_14755 [Brevundimonas sp.]|nr:MAG: hypothetical protein EON90_14755 [Brevundimonas sp.]
MRSIALASVAVLALGACNPSAPATPAPEAAAPAEAPAATPAPANVLTADGFGPLRIGMTRAEVETALGADSNPGAVGGAEPEACDVFHPARAPAGLNVMLEDGRLSRITLMRDATIKTADGLGLGATAAQVKAAHADAVVEPHKYVEGAEYITVWTGGRPAAAYVQDPAARGVRYETDAAGAVTQIHAGGPSIQLVESCS